MTCSLKHMTENDGGKWKALMFKRRDVTDEEDIACGMTLRSDIVNFL